MAKYVDVNAESREKFASMARFEGSLSLAEFQIVGNRAVLAWWKQIIASVEIGDGNRIRVDLDGPRSTMRVMNPPKNQVARTAWVHHLYGPQRRPSLEALKLEARTWEVYSAGVTFDAGAVYVHQWGRCAIASRTYNHGCGNVPQLWWASADCTPHEMEALCRKVEGRFGDGDCISAGATDGKMLA